jgi:hypothetical protein
MTKPVATAIVQGYHVEPEAVVIVKSRAACAGAEGVTFYAPTWRPLVFRSIESAKAKMERHPGFVRWAA